MSIIKQIRKYLFNCGQDAANIQETRKNLFSEVKNILKLKPDIIDNLDDNGNTPLHIAAHLGHKKIVKILLQTGANVSHQNHEEEIPLHLAVRFGYTDIMEILLEAGADVNHQNNDGKTPLHLAALNGHTKIVGILLKAGADVSHQNHVKETPLHLAIPSDHTEIVKILLEAGADANYQNNNGDTPLHIAARSGYIDIVKILITKKADITITNAGNELPLDLIYEDNQTLSILNLIAKDINSSNTHQSHCYLNKYIEELKENGNENKTLIKYLETLDFLSLEIICVFAIINSCEGDEDKIASLPIPKNIQEEIINTKYFAVELMRSLDDILCIKC